MLRILHEGWSSSISAKNVVIETRLKHGCPMWQIKIFKVLWHFNIKEIQYSKKSNWNCGRLPRNFKNKLELGKFTLKTLTNPVEKITRLGMYSFFRPHINSKINLFEIRLWNKKFRMDKKNSKITILAGNLEAADDNGRQNTVGWGIVVRRNLGRPVDRSTDLDVSYF